MKIATKRINKDITLPSYLDRAAGFDFVLRQDDVIKPGEIKGLPSNVALDLPKGHVLLLIPRSSMSNTGLKMPHSIGVIDPFLNSKDSEITILIQNVTKKTIRVKAGDKIAQGVLVKFEKVEFIEAPNKLKKIRLKK